MGVTLLLATGNPSKLRELRAIAGPYGFEILSPGDLGIALEVEETGATFAENALLKARAFYAETGVPSLADDSGLVVDALGGEPGIYSARYGGPGRDDADRTALVLERLRGMPREQRSACFVAAIAVVGIWPESRIVEDSVEGLITDVPIGDGGFGYDPIFFYEPFNATLAQVSDERKASVSHRGKALRRAAAEIARYTLTQG
jgi:XTP/dITP diphosphohydrolase